MDWIEYEQYGEFGYQMIGKITNAFKIPEEILKEEDSNSPSSAQVIFDAAQNTSKDK